jgi:drug/metabolite transporter (DMT)-like permease
MSRKGVLLFLAMSAIWGIPYLLIRVAVRHLDPETLVLGRTLPAAFLLAPLIIKRGWFRLVYKHVGWIGAFAFIEFGVPWYIMSSAEKHLTSSLTSLLVCIVPLFSVLAHKARVRDERIGPRRLLGLGLGTGGVVLLVGLDVRGGSLFWVAAMLLVAVGYSIGPIILATKLAHVPGPAIVWGSVSLVSLVYLPWAGTHLPSHISAETIWCVATLSIVCTALAFIVFFELIQEIGAARSVVVTYTNTAIAVILGIVLLSEPLKVGIIVGFPLIVIGSVLATSSTKPVSATL